MSGDLPQFSLGLLARSFVLERTLSSDPLAKSAVLLGSLLDQPCILALTRSALPASEPDLAALASQLDRWQSRGDNGIYTWGSCAPGQADGGGLDVSVVWPATDVHIRKHEQQTFRLVHESIDVYRQVTEPYIRSIPTSRTEWVQNILAGKKEQDSILLRTPDYVLLPDLKWDLKTLSSLYLTAILSDGSLRSLRNLTGDHLGLLKGLRADIEEFVMGRWGLKKGELRFFIHYQPSYYHLHIHVTHLSYVSPSGGTACERAHLLDQIISLLEMDPKIYSKLPLTYALGEQHPLFGPMQQAGVL